MQFYGMEDARGEVFQGSMPIPLLSEREYRGLGEVLGEQVVTSLFVVGYPQSEIAFIQIFCSPVQP